MWNTVSENLHKMDRTLNFSSRTCRERHENLLLGNPAIYPELKDLNLDRDVTNTRDSFFRAKLAHQEAERKADFKILRATKHYQQRTQSTPASSRQAIPSNYVLDEDDTLGSDSEEDHAAEPTVKVNTVSSQANHATEPKRLPSWEVERQLALIQLPSPYVMNREEIEAEMAARGYEAHGNLNAIRINLLYVRQGRTNFPRAKSPGDIAKFKKMLAVKEIWEYDSDETIEDEEVVGIHDKTTTTNASQVVAEKTRVGKRSRKLFSDSSSDEDILAPNHIYKRRHVFKTSPIGTAALTTALNKGSAIDADNGTSWVDKMIDRLTK